MTQPPIVSHTPAPITALGTNAPEPHAAGKVGSGTRRLSPRGKAAVVYAEQLGWAVFPLHNPITAPGAATPTECSCRYADCNADAHKWGKHPRTSNGVKGATTDTAQIAEWWRMWPDANIGVATGPPSKIVVVDIDGPAGAAALAPHIVDIKTPHARTGGGHHWVFGLPIGCEIRNGVRVLPEVDVRAAGGYIVVAPSQHGSGRLYEWDKATHPLECAPKPLPASLLSLLAPSPTRAQVTGGSDAGEDVWEQGKRNDRLFRYVASRVARNLPEHEVRSLAHAENERRCRPPLPAEEVDAIVTSAFATDRRKHGVRTEPPVPAIITASTPEDDRPSDTPLWPAPLEPPAFRGLAGDIVRLLEPHSEADPAAMLVHLLVAVGAMLGRQHFYLIEGRPHYPNLFALVVGLTSTGGKGTAWDRVDGVLSPIDPRFFLDQVVSGLSSGEGLINRLRDKLDAGAGTSAPLNPAAGGSAVPDKRLLIVEEEFSNVLTVRGREGNTLSAVLRALWGGKTLNVVTRKDPLTARDAHGAVIGHITPEELVRLLGGLDRVNGFANRFLYTASHRSAYKATPTEPAPDAVADIARRLNAVLQHRVPGRALARDREAEALWARVHERLAEGLPGQLAGLTKRGRPQVMRLALIYALLDCASSIRREHLESAIAIWQYSERTVAYVFGGRVLHPYAGKILDALPQPPAVMDRTAIRDLFGRHAEGDALDDCLRLLEAYGLIAVETEQTGGRPREVISRATKATKATKGWSSEATEGLLSLSSLLSRGKDDATVAVRSDSDAASGDADGSPQPNGQRAVGPAAPTILRPIVGSFAP